jgi:hypothetical protein
VKWTEEEDIRKGLSEETNQRSRRKSGDRTIREVEAGEHFRGAASNGLPLRESSGFVRSEQ